MQVEVTQTIDIDQPSIRDLLDQLRSGPSVVPFVGAGLSMPYGLSGWTQFLQKLSEQAGELEVVQSLLLEGKYEEAAELLSTSLGVQAFNDSLRHEFGDHALVEPNRKTPVTLLPQLAEGPVVTTNFDHVLERVFEDAGKPFDQVVWNVDSDFFVAALQLSPRYLLNGPSGNSTRLPAAG